MAFYLHVKNNTQGIGQQLFDNTSFFGSNGKLQGTIDMGNIADLVYWILLIRSSNFTLDTISHEMMHRWAAYVKFKNPDGTSELSVFSARTTATGAFCSAPMRRLCTETPGRTTETGPSPPFAPGNITVPSTSTSWAFIDRSQVPPMLLIDNPDIDPARSSEEGVTISGTPRYVTIDDIIAAEGERIPGPAESQKSFKTAFIFITAPGTFTGDELYGLENIRNGWITRYSVLTDGAGLVQVASTPKDDIPVNPGTATAAVTTRELSPRV